MTSATTPKRHPRYYVETIVFQVDDTLFRVPSRYLREKSEILAAASEISSTGTAEGLSDTTPVKLPLSDDATIEDFENFVEVVLPLTFGLPHPDGSKSKWISILKLSSCWMFDELRDLAIEQLQDLSFIELVQLGRRYKVRTWLLKGLYGLANPSNALLPLNVLETGLNDRTMSRLLYIRTWLQSDSGCKKVQADVQTTATQMIHTDGIIRVLTRSICCDCGKGKDCHSVRPHVEVEVEKMFASELSLVGQ